QGAHGQGQAGAPARGGAAHGQGRDDQAAEDQVDAQQLNGAGDGQGEQTVEGGAAQTLPQGAEPQRQHEGGEAGHGPQLAGADPEDLADQHVLEVLAPVRIAGQQQQAGGGSQHEEGADQSLLDVRPATLCPGQQGGAQQSGRHGGELGRPALRVPTQGVRGDHTQARHLGNGQIDEDDA